MSLRIIRCVAILPLVLFALGLSFTEPAQAKDRLPNIIYILADDLGYGELGCYGQKKIQTPNIDRLAAEGMKFTQHYCGNAVCAPSRCSLMTAKHPGHAYIRNNGDPDDLGHLKKKYGWQFPGQNPIPDEEVTIAEVLKQRGYATAAIGKWGLGHVGTTGDPNKQGFDLFYGFNCQRHAHNHYPRFLWRNNKRETQPGNDRSLSGETYSQDQFTKVALEFIEENRDRPFFLYLPFAVPHLGIQVPEKSLAQYKGKLPEKEYTHRGSNYVKHPFPHAGYAAMISHMDRDIGTIVDRVKQLGLDEETLVIFTSDNGPTFAGRAGADSTFFDSAAGFRGLKASVYEGGIRVPMIARWTGKIKPGTTSDHISAFWDVMPTLAELTGTQVPADIDGISFAPTLLGNEQDQKQHDFLYWEFVGYRGHQAIRQGDWKAVRTNILQQGNKNALRISLFNLKSDPGETKDVAAEHPEIVEQLRKKMAASHTPSKLFPMAPLDKESKAEK